MIEQTQGYFITIEGIEGAGKSTALQFLRSELEQQGIAPVFTREPGGTQVGEKIRELLLNRATTNMAVDTELLLMFASRAQLVNEVIKPTLAAGQWVISDRFTDASYAYQGGGRHIPLERIAVLEQWVQADLRPDLTILLDVPVEIGLQRMQQCKQPDRIESEQAAFFERVRAVYLQRAAAEPERYRIIDATQPLSDIQRQLQHIVNELTTVKAS